MTPEIAAYYRRKEERRAIALRIAHLFGSIPLESPMSEPKLLSPFPTEQTIRVLIEKLDEVATRLQTTKEAAADLLTNISLLETQRDELIDALIEATK